MVDLLPVVPDTRLVGAVDARDILSVQDAHGGVTIYYQGRPSLYVLAGEWYRAFPEPEARGRATLARVSPPLGPEPAVAVSGNSKRRVV